MNLKKKLMSRFTLMSVRFVIWILGFAQFADVGFLLGQEKPPEGQVIIESDLVEGKPFDQVTLDPTNGNFVLKIEPLLTPPPIPLPQQGLLIFEEIDGSGDTLQVPWGNIVDYQTFNDLLLKEAKELTTAGKYALAFRNLLYVYDHGGKDDPRIERQLRAAMFLDARLNFENGNYDLALSIFEDVFQRDPTFMIPGANRKLIDLILDCHGNNVNQLVQQGAYQSARQVLANVEATYGQLASPLMEKWNLEFTKLHRNYLNEAAQAAQAGDELLARQRGQRSLSVIPNNAESIQFINELIEKQPLVIVGVTQSAANLNPDRLEHWASRRVGQLTERRLLEFSGVSDEGGRYEFVSGRVFQTDEAGLVYRFQIDPEKTGFAIPKITSYHVAGQFLRYADASNPKCVTAWAKIVDSVSVIDDFTVEVRLKIPLVRPEAFLRLPYANDAGEMRQSGAYVIAKQDERVTTFQPNPVYKQEDNQQLPELAEVLFENQYAAADALLRGEIDAIDRVSPNDLPRLRRNPNIAVRSYLVPTVHMLVPNRRNEFMKHNLFRSGLLKAINREQILGGFVGRSNNINGVQVIDGPFPIGMENLDQIAYAYNTRVTKINFNEQMGRALIEATRLEKLEKLVKQGVQSPQIKLPEVILAYPQGDVPGAACAAIAQMWNQIGVVTKLRRLAPGETIPPDKEYDFLYLELMITEPLSDADYLFGSNGVVRDTNAAIEQMTRQAGVSTSWRVASLSLRQLHRQVLNDTAILPLWQFREFYAYRQNVRSVGRDLISIYQNIDQWRLDPIEPSEDSK